MKLSEASFTVFDVETTGLYPYSGDRICEIGAVRTSPTDKSLKRFHSLVDPERAISPGARAVNGITDEMVSGMPTIDVVLPRFIDFIEGSVLVAYNAGFDLGFIEESLGEQKDLLSQYLVIDALRLSRRLLPGIGRYNLGSVADRLGISTRGEHRAMADAMMTFKIFQVLLKELDELGATDIEELSGSYPRPSRATAAVDTASLAIIESAIRNGKSLKIRYRSSWDNTITDRVITPKRIHRGYDRSYVVADCHMRGAERNFRLDCIIKAEERSQPG